MGTHGSTCRPKTIFKMVVRQTGFTELLTPVLGKPDTSKEFPDTTPPWEVMKLIASKNDAVEELVSSSDFGINRPPMLYSVMLSTGNIPVYASRKVLYC